MGMGKILFGPSPCRIVVRSFVESLTKTPGAARRLFQFFDGSFQCMTVYTIEVVRSNST